MECGWGEEKEAWHSMGERRIKSKTCLNRKAWETLGIEAANPSGKKTYQKYRLSFFRS